MVLSKVYVLTLDQSHKSNQKKKPAADGSTPNSPFNPFRYSFLSLSNPVLQTHRLQRRAKQSVQSIPLFSLLIVPSAPQTHRIKRRAKQSVQSIPLFSPHTVQSSPVLQSIPLFSPLIVPPKRRAKQSVQSIPPERERERERERDSKRTDCTLFFSSTRFLASSLLAE